MNIGWVDRAKQWARSIKRDVVALWLAGQDSRTPVVAKILALLIAAYALSPIDLIPDFIPVIGYLDDLLIVPLGIMAAVSLIPADLMAEFRTEADRLQRKPVSRGGLVGILLVWIFLAGLVGWHFVGNEF